MSEEQHWHYLIDGEQHGPVGGEELQELASAGMITGETPVWTEALDEWIAAGTVEGLFPEHPAPRGPRLITGAAAQTAAPLGASPAPAPSAHPGFALGGSLAGGPHLPGPVGHGAGLAPGTLQTFQIRSIGILQAGVVCALLFAITFLILALLFMVLGGLLAASLGDSELVGALAGGGVMLLVGPILYGIFGFLYGMIAALIYNLAAKMCGGLVIKVQAKAAW